MEHKKCMYSVICFYLHLLPLPRISCALEKGTLTWSKKMFSFSERALDIKDNRNSKLNGSPSQGKISPKLSQKSTTLFCQKGLHRNSSFYREFTMPQRWLHLNKYLSNLFTSDWLFSKVCVCVFFFILAINNGNPSNKGDHKAIPTLGSKTQLGKIRQVDWQKAERGVKHTA